MWFPSIEQLQNINESSALILLSWSEMFSPSTPDSFQPKLMNVPMLVEELQETASKATKNEKWQKYVQKIQEELKFVCEVDQAFLQTMPRYAWSLNKLCNEQDVSQVSALAKTLQPIASAFERQTVEALQNCLAKLPAGKESTLKALRRFATIAQRKGCDADDFEALYQPENLTRSPDEILKTLLALVNKSNREFICYVAVKGAAHDLQVVARKVGFKLVSARYVESIVELNGEQKADDVVWLSIEVQAIRPKDAARSALRRLRPALDVFNFYRHDALTASEQVIVIDEHSKAVAARFHRQWVWQLRQRENATELTKELMDGAMDSRLSGRIFNALEHYSLSQTSTASRVKLVNLWSAMECLTSSEESESIIGNVCSAVVPIAVWRRTSKILSYTAGNIQQFHELAGGSLGPGFPSNRHVSSQHLLLVLSQPEGHPDCEALQAYVAPHPHLRQRIYDLWKLFNAPQHLAQELKISERRKEWQLYRIYRARNLIIHEGLEVSDVPHLLENLHYYFSVSLSRILHGMKLNQKWEVSDAVVYWRTRHQFVLSALETKPSSLSIGDFFPLPTPPLRNRLIWPDAKSTKVQQPPAAPKQASAQR